jgi:hypothetical protein
MDDKERWLTAFETGFAVASVKNRRSAISPIG